MFLPGTSDVDQRLTGLIESLLLENAERFRGKLIEFGKVPLSITITDDEDEYPVKVDIQRFEASMPPKIDATQKRRRQIDHGARRERRVLAQTRPSSSLALKGAPGSHRQVLRAKYVVGCDGAHSWTRKHLSIPFRGQHTYAIWGVMDLIPLTNFPDVRKNCMIQSDRGNLLLIPRESRLVRLYVKLSEDRSSDWKTAKTPQLRAAIMERAQSILLPYHFTYKYCDWSSCYVVGQRLADSFSVKNRIFLAGDASRTFHSILSSSFPSINEGRGRL